MIHHASQFLTNWASPKAAEENWDAAKSRGSGSIVADYCAIAAIPILPMHLGVDGTVALHVLGKPEFERNSNSGIQSKRYVSSGHSCAPVLREYFCCLVDLKLGTTTCFCSLFNMCIIHFWSPVLVAAREKPICTLFAHQGFALAGNSLGNEEEMAPALEFRCHASFEYISAGTMMLIDFSWLCSLIDLHWSPHWIPHWTRS